MSGPNDGEHVTARRTIPSLDDYARDLSRLRCAVGGRAVGGGRRLGSQGTVSAITVCFNSSRTVARTIDSVAGQTYVQVEYIVVDGGSDDGTVDVLRSRAADIDLWLSEGDRGISDAFNKGIALASGEFIALVNADDWLEPTHLEKAVAILRENDADFVFGNLMVHGPDGAAQYSLSGDPRYGRSIRHAMPDINHPTVVCRRRVFELHGLFDTGLRIAMDYDWLLRGYLCSVRGAYVPDLTSHMEVGGLSQRSARAALREVRDISIRHGYSRWLAGCRFLVRLARVRARMLVERWISPDFAQRVRAVLHPGYRSFQAGTRSREWNGTG
jgi:glycosyltransferase involved in cell wall biosynthesis